MGEQSQTQVNIAPAPKPSFTAAQGGLLQRKCACGGSQGLAGACKECDKERLTLQRYSTDRAKPYDLARTLAEAFDPGAGATVAVGSGHDFSRMQIHSRAPHRVQTKLAVSRPGDQYEQEADRIAEQVTRSSAPSGSEANQHSAALSRIQPLIQRQANDETAASPEVAPTPTPSPAEPAATEEAATAGLIVEDDAGEIGPGQMRKSEFLDELRAAICAAADAELAAVGRSAEGCPYIERWISFYRTQSGQRIERAIHRYASEAAGAPTARDYTSLISERVRRAVAVWARTGEITGAPEGFSTETPAASAGAGVEGSPTAAGNVQFKGRDGGVGGAGDPMAIQAQLGSGYPLDGGVRSRMESAFGHNFSHVRVHTDTMAAGLSESLNARAFTVGAHVAFGAGEYRPGTLIGDALIAHELAHAVQQGGSDSLAPMRQGSAGYNALEEDADLSAVGAVASLWGGAKGKLKDIAQHAMPRLRSGLRLSRCPDEKKPVEKKIEQAPQEKSAVPASPPGEGWIRNDTPGGQKFGAGDIEGTYYIDASASAKGQKTPAKVGDQRILDPSYAGAYVTFSDKSKGSNCGNGSGDRAWLSHKYYKEFTIAGVQAPSVQLDQWSVDIAGNFVTNNKDFEDLPGTGASGKQGISGYIRRSYHIGIVCSCTSDSSKKAKGFLSEYSFNFDIWFNHNDVAVRVVPGNSYGGSFDWCKTPPTGVTCVDSCPASEPAPKPPEQKKSP